MNKYHFSTVTEKAEICGAQKRKCRYGDHFETLQSAESYAAKFNENKYQAISSLSKKDTTDTSVEISDKLQQSFDIIDEYSSQYNRDSEFKEQKEFTEILKHIISTDTSSLHNNVIEDDESFRKLSLPTINQVHRLVTEGGEVGYFKPMRESGKKFYDINPIQESINEVAAYKLSQALGIGFDNLVPETTIRMYDGKIGSIQKEAAGKTACEASESGSTSVDSMQLAHCIVFDYIVGSLDRHSGNYMFDTPPPQYKLIDNGLSFVHNRNTKDFHEVFGYNRRLSFDNDLLDEIKPKVQNLLDSSDSLGMNKFLDRESIKELRNRAQRFIDFQPRNIDDEDDLWE